MDAPNTARSEKKTVALSCAEPETPRHDAGRVVYNKHCYFCHGYGGDGRTAAATYLRPRPLDLTRALHLTAETIGQTVRDGSPGSAMPSFVGVLSETDIEAVADFVEDAFIRCRGRNTAYHTAQNGWPDHAKRNGRAFPFVRGSIPVDTDAKQLTRDQHLGLQIFRRACIVCHDGRSESDAGWASTGEVEHSQHKSDTRTTTSAAVATAHEEHPQTSHSDHGHHEEDDEDHHHDEEYDRAYYDDEVGPHDIAPHLLSATPRERLGETLYQENCAICHAADGTAKNWIGTFLRPNPPDLTAASAQQRLDRAGIAAAILDGREGTSMPAFRSALTDEQARAIAAYVWRVFVTAGPR